MQSPSTHPRAALHPVPLAGSRATRFAIGLAATAVVAAAAHISFPLPWTLVPLTLQPLAVLGVGLYFAPGEAFLVMLAYLAEGAAGLPVFSPHGPGGLLQLLGPTGGYLLSYPFVAALTSLTVRALYGRVSAFLAALLATSAAVLLLYLCGAGWLMHLLRLSPTLTFQQGVLPFIPGEIVKVLAASGTYSALRTFRRS